MIRDTTTRRRIADALLREHYRRTHRGIADSPEATCAALADAVLAELDDSETWTDAVLAEVAAERVRQIALHGQQHYPNGTTDRWLPGAQQARDILHHAAARGTVTWATLIHAIATKAMAESHPAALRAILLRLSAEAVAWIEDIDQRDNAAPRPTAEQPTELDALLSAVAEQLPAHDPQKCANTLAEMNRRANARPSTAQQEGSR